MTGPLANPRWERYAQLRFEGKTSDEAHTLAGFTPNRGNAARLNANQDVQRRIAELQAAVADKTVVDAAWVLNRLYEEAEADVADLYDEAGQLKHPKDWPPIWRKGLVAGLDVEELRAEGASIGTVRKVRLSDRIKRVELLGKHVTVQAFREQMANTGEMRVVFGRDEEDL